SRLRKPLAEAEAIIDERIAAGEAILTTLRHGPLPPDAKAWHEKNEAILQRLFTTEAEYHRYRTCVIAAIRVAYRGMPQDDDEKPSHEKRLQALRSLRNSLDVYELSSDVSVRVVAPRPSSSSYDAAAVCLNGHVFSERLSAPV